MVDHTTWRGDYSGIQVYGNTIESRNGALIKIGIAVGDLSEATIAVVLAYPLDLGESSYNNGGNVSTNHLSSSTGGYFGYAMYV